MSVKDFDTKAFHALSFGLGLLETIVSNTTNLLQQIQTGYDINSLVIQLYLYIYIYLYMYIHLTIRHGHKL